MGVEEARALRAAKDQQMRRGRWAAEGEELRADGNAGDFGVAEPFGGSGKIDGRGLHAFAHQAIGKAGHGVGLKDQRRNLEPQRGRHAGPGGVTADAEDHAGLELADQPLAIGDALRQADDGFEAGEQRDLVERARVDELEAKAGLGDEADSKAARRADEASRPRGARSARAPPPEPG